MGRCYAFECPRCGFRAKVSGGADGGENCSAITILCRDCRQLYDVATHVRVPSIGSLPASVRLNLLRGRTVRKLTKVGLKILLPNHIHLPRRIASVRSPPPLEMLTPRPDPRWTQLAVECPVASHHQISPWNHPGKCPRCQNFLERSLIPWRLWT